MLPLSVGIARGSFAKVGLQVSTELVSGGAPVQAAAFLNNDIDAIGGSPSVVIEDIDEGVLTTKEGKYFDQLQASGYDLVAEKSITSISQLEGKTLGISGPGGADELYFEAVLNKYKIPLSSVTFVTSGSAPARLAAVSNGTIGATANANNDRSADGVGNILLYSNQSPVTIPGFAIFGSTALMKHTAELKKFVQVMIQSTTWMRHNEIAATPICEAATSGTAASCDASIAANFLRTIGGPYTWSSTEAVDIAGVKSAINLLASLIPHLKLTIPQIVDTAITGTTPSQS
jgi:ABC-type nitrate/sulfonate/bicarbonate transport system substrate-binding protein